MSSYNEINEKLQGLLFVYMNDTISTNDETIENQKEK